MSIIEKATRRLQELERAGISVPYGPGVAQPGVGVVRPPSAGEVAETNASNSAPAADTRRLRPSSPSRQSTEIAVDTVRLGQLGYLVPGALRSDVADEFRVIKRPLLANTKAVAPRQVARANLIMVTSALPGEGKTFCALNLALSIATEVDSSVLLVDADVLRPALLERIGVEGKHLGLLDLLANPDMDVADVMLKTNIPKLSLIPAGVPRIDSNELLASAAMEQLLLDLSEKYRERIIIFDAPPLLATTEAKVLASRVGQILVVVDESRAHQDEVRKAFALLKESPVVLAILNKSRMRAETGRYGYYAGVGRNSQLPMRS